MSSTPQERLSSDLKEAMKARQGDRVQTLRLLLSAVGNRRIELGRELDESDFTTVVRKAVKQREEAAEQYRMGKREELAVKEEAEIRYLEPYLPQPVAEAELRRAIREIVESEGLSGPKGMGTVMKAMMARYGAAADGKEIGRLAREILQE
jgi:hypothetical protein